MIGLIITLATISGYFAIGFTWSKRMLPKWWEVARREWSSDGNVKSSVKQQWFFKAIAWPICMIIDALAPDFDKFVNQADPETMRKEAEERERRIQELERELGIR